MTNTQFKDNRGTTLAIGQTVCYNYSGEIAMGIITEIKTIPVRNAWSSVKVRAKITVKQTHPRPGTISTVTNHHNLMAVNEK